VCVVVADLDGDDIPDLATANTGSSDVSVLLGNGDGSFQSAASFVVDGDPQYVAVADLDGDTFPDLVTANAFPGTVSVLLNSRRPGPDAEIDIAPHSDRNLVLALPRVPFWVALLGSEIVDVRGVDETTLAFGPGEAPPALPPSHRLALQWLRRDVNGDGFDDLLVPFRYGETELPLGRGMACLRGEIEGESFEACDHVLVILPACGLGFELALVLPLLMRMRRRRRTEWESA
jgi:hypothetical protein